MARKNITVVGMGFVGLTHAATLAEKGHNVIGVETWDQKLNWLNDYVNGKNDQFPLFEKDLPGLTKKQHKEGRLSFTDSLEEALETSDMMFIGVGTPTVKDGYAADLTDLFGVASDTKKLIDKDRELSFVIKSTVPPGTAKKVKRIFDSYNVTVVNNPEFLAEGTAVKDSRYPDRVVIGSDNSKVIQELDYLYKPFLRQGNPFLPMDNVSAEIAKYQNNVTLAAQVVMANIGANLARKAGGDWEKVKNVIRYDQRQGSFIHCSLGFGGSCFPKDVRQYLVSLQEYDCGEENIRFIQALLDQNDAQKLVLNKYIHDYYGHDLTGKTIAVWGLSFKKGTSDTRESSAIDIAKDLLLHGAKVNLYDPEAINLETGKAEFENHLTLEDKSLLENITYFKNSGHYDALEGTHALIIPTEWDRFANADIERVIDSMERPAIFDGRNIWYKERFGEDLKADYFSVGREPYKLL